MHKNYFKQIVFRGKAGKIAIQFRQWATWKDEIK